MISFKRYLTEVAITQPQSQTSATPQYRSGGGTLQGAQGGGAGGNWGGSLPKLISILPPGNWYAGSQKRGKVNTKSGGMSDHYTGNSIAYAGDFGLNSTFKGNTQAATQFAISVARNAGGNVNSWAPFVGKAFNYNTSDGYRVQVIWQSNVGGNHYDHVHVGVKKGAGAFSNDVESQDVDLPPGGADVPSPDGSGGTTPEEPTGSPAELFGQIVQGISQIANYGKVA